jgi:thiosulfate dehydrogenase [quinone] large subunit
MLMTQQAVTTTPTRKGAESDSSYIPTAGRPGRIAIAALRVSLGLVFLWAFLDKTFGLGYATPSERAWISGGSPTNGFLSHVAVGPFESAFQSIAGTWWADWLFMLGLLSIGVALVLGVALRLTAAAGTVMMVLMWAAEWPLAQFTSGGAATGSSHPFMDYHLIYALSMIVLAVIGAGRYFGLGRWWSGMTNGNVWLR